MNIVSVCVDIVPGTQDIYTNALNLIQAAKYWIKIRSHFCTFLMRSVFIVPENRTEEGQWIDKCKGLIND